MKLKVVLLLSLAVCNSIAALTLNKFNTNTYPNAKCTDGTQSGYYYKEGSGANKNKILFYFQGGGGCLAPTEDLIGQACTARRSTDQGSSTNWKSTFDLNFPEDEKVEPKLNEWTKVYLPYCDGFAFQGTRADVWSYKGVDFYFRGADNVKATIADIKLKFASSNIQVTDILVTGYSAGGLATFYYADFIKDQFNSIQNLKFWAAPDSGFFINHPSLETQTTVLGISTRIMVGKILSRTATDIYPQNCDVINDPLNAYKCISPEYIAPKIKSNLFIIQSNYDTYQLRNFYQQQCVEDNTINKCDEKAKTLAHALKETTVKRLNEVLQAKSNSSTWSISCAFHVAFREKNIYRGDNYQVPEKSGNTALQSLKAWMNQSSGERKSYIDTVNWPNNTKCSGIEQKKESSFSILNTFCFSMIIALVALLI